MKKQLLAVLIGTILVAPLMAHAEGSYIGFNAGHSNQDVSVDGQGSQTYSSTGYKLYGGYGFTKNFGVEVGYVDFGSASTPNFHGLPVNATSIQPSAAYVAATATLPLNDQFSLLAKVGASFNHLKVDTIYSGIFSQNKTTALLGVGASYSINKNLILVAEYEDFGKVASDSYGESLKVNLLSVGVRYKF